MVEATYTEIPKPTYDEMVESSFRQAERIDRLWEALRNLHDWYVEYAKLNHLFNKDGSPATFHELLEARKLLSE